MGSSGNSSCAFQQRFVRLLVLLGREEGQGGRRALPRRRSECLARPTADGKHRRPVFLGDGPSLCRRIANEDDRAGRCVDRLAVDRERRSPLDHEVELLVALRARADLVVLADDVRAGLGRAPGVDSETADVQMPADRGPSDRRVAGRDLDLGQRRHLELLAHDCVLNSSSTTGSIASAPSTRSSRFSFPAQRKRASPSSPS